MTYDLFTSGAPRVPMERLAEAIAAVDPIAEREDADGVITFVTADRIVIELRPDDADIAVPYWYEGEQAEAVVARLPNMRPS